MADKNRSAPNDPPPLTLFSFPSSQPMADCDMIRHLRGVFFFLFPLPSNLLPCVRMLGPPLFFLGNPWRTKRSELECSTFHSMPHSLDLAKRSNPGLFHSFPLRFFPLLSVRLRLVIRTRRKPRVAPFFSPSLPLLPRKLPWNERQEKLIHGQSACPLLFPTFSPFSALSQKKSDNSGGGCSLFLFPFFSRFG